MHVYPCITRTFVSNESRLCNSFSVGSAHGRHRSHRSARGRRERTSALRNGLRPGDLRGRAAAAADRCADGLPRGLGGARACGLRDGAGAAALQPDRLGARRGRADAARLSDGVRGAHAARGRGRLHDARGEDELRPPDHGRHGPHPLRGHRDPQGVARRDRGGEGHGRRREAPRARDDDLPALPAAHRSGDR